MECRVHWEQGQPSVGWWTWECGVVASVGCFFGLVKVLQVCFVGSNADLWLRFLQEHLEVWTLLLWPKLWPLWLGFDLSNHEGISEMWERHCWAPAEARGMAGVVHPSKGARMLGWTGAVFVQPGWKCCLQHGKVKLHARVRPHTHTEFLFTHPFFSKTALTRGFHSLLWTFAEAWEVSPFREAVWHSQHHPAPLFAGARWNFCALGWAHALRPRADHSPCN